MSGFLIRIKISSQIHTQELGPGYRTLYADIPCIRATWRAALYLLLFTSLNFLEVMVDETLKFDVYQGLKIIR